ncbi:MAG: ABC transporter ATP-binding protein [Chloroflexi bacterium]|nr:ABC transporter ATP-binding protein [Chloroflexota bacterium]
MSLAIRIRKLGKRYRLGANPSGREYQTLRDLLTQPWRWFRREPATYIWALREIDLDVEAGQVLGLIGPNGAGKSTLLKILSRVTYPTTGRAELYGRVGSLLEVGTGFHPELTGRENIYLNGAILGMTKAEIDRKFDEIVAFAGVEAFIDTPVKFYSSGMYLRLAFAVAAHLEPEILLVDEVLAVGDAEFQRKSLGKMEEVAHSGRTVVFVSHNMSAILSLTQRAVVLRKGRIVFDGPTPEAVDFYLSSGMRRTGERIWQPEEIPASAYPFQPIALRIRDARGRVTDAIAAQDPITLEWEYALHEPIRGLRVGIYLLTMRGEYVFTSFDTDDLEAYQRWRTRPAGHYISRVRIPGHFLNTGRYVLSVNASTYGYRTYFHEENVLAFLVDPTGAVGSQWPERRLGVVRPLLDWEIERVDERVPEAPS